MIEIVLTLLVVSQIAMAWRMFLARKAILALFGIIGSMLDILTTQNKIEILKSMEQDVDKIELEFRRIIDSI
jgi:hypothetical protein